MKISEIATALGLECVRDAEIHSLGFIHKPAPAMLAFVESDEYAAQASAQPDIGAVIAAAGTAVPERLGVIVSAKPRRDFFRIHSHLAARTDFYTAHAGANRISSSARVHAGAFLAESGVEIGEGSVVEAGVVIQAGTVVGKKCIIRAGCVLGGEGFEFKRDGGRIVAEPHTGGVRLGDEVELQQGCTVDRSLFGGYTEIGDQTKLDNLVHVAHNCRIGQRCLIAASAVVSGSVTVEDDVWIGPAAVISDSVTIGAGARVAIGSVIVKSVPAGAYALGRALGHKLQQHDA